MPQSEPLLATARPRARWLELGIPVGSRDGTIGTVSKKPKTTGALIMARKEAQRPPFTSVLAIDFPTTFSISVATVNGFCRKPAACAWRSGWGRGGLHGREDSQPVYRPVLPGVHHRRARIQAMALPQSGHMP